MILNEKYTLKNGVEIPKMALGTWQVSNEAVTGSVNDAISVGYRHIDTAAAYQNEEGVGKGIAMSGVSRNDIFITTKVPAEIKTYEGAKKSIEGSLKDLNTDYIDLLLIHAPKPWDEMFVEGAKSYLEENLQVWKAMEEAYKEGKVKAIGVSNFTVEDLQNILDNCEIEPVVDQVRAFAGSVPEDIFSFCEERQILIEGYSPIATGELLKNEAIKEMADKYQVSIAQLCIRYLLQRGILPLPKTTHKEYMAQNAAVDFVISEEDMNTLNNVK